MAKQPRQSGFTFIELIVVIIILGILSALLIPRYWEVSRQARLATLDGVVAAMRSSIGITRAKALSQGIRVTTGDPGAGQANYVVDMEGFSVEVDWANLCPESRSEINETRSMLDYIMMEDNTWVSGTSVFNGELFTLFDNQFTYVGYDIRESGPGGCYVRYDSFGDRTFPGPSSCTVELIIDDC